ncbi:MAG: hypothetical protein SFX73_06735 [Kofleriaceae bacterium]|nr:hypothetical protein [Kofleriaceae bacterium]
MSFIDLPDQGSYGLQRFITDTEYVMLVASTSDGITRVVTAHLGPELGRTTAIV